MVNRHGAVHILLGLMILIGLMVIIPIGVGADEGTTYYVATGGNDAWPGTLSNPWASIDHAATVMQAGDTVLIRGGEYSEGVETRRSGADGALITFRAYPGEHPVLDGTGVAWDNGFTIAGENSYIRVEGLAIRDFAGAGMLIRGNNQHIEIIDVEVSNSSTGIHLTDYSMPGGVVDDLLIEDSYIHHNSTSGINCTPGPCRHVQIINTISANNGAGGQTTADGFAIETGEDILVERCQAIGNAGDGFDLKSDAILISRSMSRGNDRNGINLLGTGNTLENSISRDNLFAGIVLMEGGTYTLTNNTVAHNAISSGGYGMHVAFDAPATAELNLYNNIFAFNGGAVYFGEHVSLTADHNIYYSSADSEIQAEFTTGSMTRHSYSRQDINYGIWCGETGNGCHSGAIDPMFVDRDGRNYHLQIDSPAVDSGSNAWAPALDYDGVSRPQDEFVDIGAYEYVVPEYQRRIWLPLSIK